MNIYIDDNGSWYHGSPYVLTELRTGSSVTQWRALAEAFSHKPHTLSYEDDGSIVHDGSALGYLYVVDEPVSVTKDVYPHPHSSMDANVEFLTSRPLRVRLIDTLPMLNAQQSV